MMLFVRIHDSELRVLFTVYMTNLPPPQRMKGCPYGAWYTECRIQTVAA